MCEPGATLRFELQLTPRGSGPEPDRRSSALTPDLGARTRVLKLERRWRASAVTAIVTPKG